MDGDDDTLPTRRWPPAFVPLHDFEVAAIDAITAEVSTVDVWDLERAFSRASEAAEGEGRRPAAAAFHLLSGAMSIVLRPADKGAAWGPRQTNGAYRSPAPEDLRGDQTPVLADLASLVAHPGLKARLADLAWTNDRKLGRAAATAIEGYCEAAERLLSGAASPRFGKPERSSFEALHLVERALYLARRTRKRGEQPTRVVQALEDLYRAGLEDHGFVVARRAADLGLYYELFDGPTVAADLEALAKAPRGGASSMVIKDLLDLAAHLYGEAGDAAAERRCQLAAVEQILEMRQEVSGAGAEAHWVQTALFALRHIPDTDAWRRSLRQELRDLQEDSLGEFGRFSVPLDLGDERDAELRAFGGLSLSQALKELACISRSRPIAELRDQALKNLEHAPLSGMMPIKYSDQDGRTAANSPGAPVDGEPDEEWFKATINSNEAIRRQIVLAGRFEPARHSIVSRFDIDERHLMPIVRRSPFVRQEQKPLMALGLARLLQGDDRSAVHLLTPQLEPGLRYLLRLAGHDPTVEFDDMTEEDVGLPALLGRFRPALERILPPEVVLEIELLFHHRPGSALRHSVAHGTVGAGGCFTVDAIYGCWLIYQLTCWPLLAKWDADVGPDIEAVG